MTTSIHFPLRALSLALTLAVASAWPASAQMVTGAAMEDFSKSFGLSGEGWSVEQTSCSLGANALWPGEEATFTFFVKPGKPYLKKVVVEHGRPKGPINAVELWNEPWESVSISGWGADIPRYREIYQVMAEAVLEARQEAGVKVLIGGACSSANTRDKLFCDGTDTFLPWLDFVSIHYQPLAADPVLEPKG